MTAKPPLRRSFKGVWDRISYYHDHLLYWLHERGDRRLSHPYASRLKTLLAEADPHQDSIFGAECRSLISEAEGDLHWAIKHREKEIALIRRLRDISLGKPHEAVALKGYGVADLSGRLCQLAILLHDNGEFARAVDTLREAKRLCEAQGIAFEGADLLAEYSEESNGAEGSPVFFISSGLRNILIDTSLFAAAVQSQTYWAALVTGSAKATKVAHKPAASTAVGAGPTCVVYGEMLGGIPFRTTGVAKVENSRATYESATGFALQGVPPRAADMRSSAASV